MHLYQPIPAVLVLRVIQEDYQIILPLETISMLKYLTYSLLSIQTQ